MKPEHDGIDSERQYLEGLLVSRIGFYLIFAPVYLQFAYQAIVGPWIRTVVLGIGTVASVLLGLAIWRTHCLVQAALDKIADDPSHPYVILKKDISWPPWNANKILLGIPLIITFLFVVLTCASLPPCLLPAVARQGDTAES
jgi:hypothetical protein